MTINVGLIGYGYWGKNILRNLKNFTNINNIYCLDHLNYKNSKKSFFIKMKNYFLKPL